MTLLELPIGEMARVVGIQGGWGVQRNLAALGILPGKLVRKIATQPIGGPIMVEIAGGMRVAIGRGMAQKILVEREIR